MASKSNADTTHMSNEEISKHNLHSSKRPPGKSPGGVLHQHGGATRVRSYPMGLAAVAVVAGVGSWAYFRSKHPDPSGQAGSHSPAVQKAQEDAKPK